MNNKVSPPRIFISYTALDVRDHADVVIDVIRRLEWIPIDHHDWGASGKPTVDECRQRVLSCDILVVLIAHRYGWIPSRTDGGDGEASITWLEVRWAQESGIKVLPYIVEEDAKWLLSHIEGLTDAEALNRLNEFKTEMKKRISGFFSDPRSLLDTMHLDLIKAEKEVRSKLVESIFVATPTPRLGNQIVSSAYDPSNPPTLLERLTLRLPKRVLSIDDGGSRNIITIRYLIRLENLLRIRYAAPTLVLSEYLDLVGGIGTGCLIATGVELGWSANRIREFYIESMIQMFARKASIFSRIRFKYDSRPLFQLIDKEFAGELLDDTCFSQTGIALVGLDLDRGGPRHFTNHPRDFESQRIRKTPLSRILYSTISTPTYHEPISLNIDDRSIKIVDGTLCIGNDPSLYLLLLATNEQFSFRWRLGERWLAMFSLGSGRARRSETRRSVEKLTLFDWATTIPSIMMNGAGIVSGLLLDLLAQDEIPVNERLTDRLALTHRRYDIAADAALMDEAQRYFSGSTSIEERHTREAISVLDEIGSRSANRQIFESDLLPTLDI